MKCDTLVKITRFTIEKIRYDELDCRFSVFLKMPMSFCTSILIFNKRATFTKITDDFAYMYQLRLLTIDKI